MGTALARVRAREKMRATRITDKTPFGLQWQWTLALSDLPANARLVAIVLRMFGDADGKGINPSVETISLTTGLSISTVQRAIKALLDSGFMVGARSKGRDASRFELAIPGRQPGHCEGVRPCHGEGVEDIQPGQIEGSTRSNAAIRPGHCDTESSNKNLVLPSRATKGASPTERRNRPQQIGDLLSVAAPSRPISAPLPADRPQGSLAVRQAEPAPQTSTAPQRTRGPADANALIQSELGRLAAMEGWILSLHSFAKEHGRLPDATELPDVKTAGQAFTRRIDGDNSPLSKAARKRRDALNALVGAAAPDVPACTPVNVIYPAFGRKLA